jgi:endo-beta-N-acetylglucosaminidase D
LAATASEKDIEEMMDYIDREDVVELDYRGNQKRVVTDSLPQHWRHMAKYLYADKMLEARAKP